MAENSTQQTNNQVSNQASKITSYSYVESLNFEGIFYNYRSMRWWQSVQHIISKRCKRISNYGDIISDIWCVPDQEYGT